MAFTQEELNNFHQFASAQVDENGDEIIGEGLLDLRRASNPPPEELRENVRAVKAVLRDLESGETRRSFEGFASDFRRRNALSDDA